MKVFSVRQPWAWAILHAGKRIENRSWAPEFRGAFLLHASKTCGRFDYLESVSWMVTRGLARHELFKGYDAEHLPVVPPLEQLPRGGIVGRARLVDVLPPPSALAIPRNVPREQRHAMIRNAGGDGWRMRGQFGLVLDDVVELPFEPLLGCLGFFDLDTARLNTPPRVTMEG